MLLQQSNETKAAGSFIDKCSTGSLNELSKYTAIHIDTCLSYFSNIFQSLYNHHQDDYKEITWESM
jgi:hypothetical protein